MVYHLSDIRQGILQSMVEKQNWVKLFLQSYWDVRLIVFITKGEKDLSCWFYLWGTYSGFQLYTNLATPSV